MKNKDKKTTKFTAKIKQSASHYGMSYKRKMQTKLYTLFRTRGGSFYGIGYIITLLFLEAQNFISQIADFDISVSNFVGQIIQHLIRFSIETILNLFYASIWPLIIFNNFSKEYSMVIISSIFIGYLLLRYFLKKTTLNPYFDIPQNVIKHINDTVINHFENESIHEQLDVFLTEEKPFVDKQNNSISLLAKAQHKKLDHWRSHPDSCLALILLLYHFDDDRSEILSLQQQYSESIVVEAITAKLHEALSFEEKCYLYLPLMLSTQTKHKKVASKFFRKMNKNSNSIKQKWLQQFAQNFDVQME